MFNETIELNHCAQALHRTLRIAMQIKIIRSLEIKVFWNSNCVCRNFLKLIIHQMSNLGPITSRVTLKWFSIFFYSLLGSIQRDLRRKSVEFPRRLPSVLSVTGGVTAACLSCLESLNCCNEPGQPPQPSGESKNMKHQSLLLKSDKLWLLIRDLTSMSMSTPGFQKEMVVMLWM